MQSRDQWGERLPRVLGLTGAWAVVVGSTIGSGIFRTPAIVAERLDSPTAFWAAWILGGVIALAGALTLAELAARFPRSGGLYVYLREAFGPLVAFLFGWVALIVIRPAAYGAIGITAAEYTLRLFGVDGMRHMRGVGMSFAQALAIGYIAVVAAVNYRGVRLGAAVQNVSTLLKTAVLLGIIAIGFTMQGDVGAAGLRDAPGEDAALSGLAPVGVALIAIMWAYDGWADLGFMAGEVRDPQRTLPRALILGTATVVVLYLSVIAAYTTTIPLPSMGGSPLVAADFAHAVLGPLGVTLVSGAVAISTFGTLNGTMMTGPRVFFAMAEDGLLFRRLSRLHPRYHTPAAAITLAAALGAAYVSVNTFAELADQFVISIWPFYVAAVIGVFVFRRRKPHLQVPYRIPLFPWPPIVFVVASVYLLADHLLKHPVSFSLDVLVILTGVPTFFWLNARRRGGPLAPLHSPTTPSARE